MEKRILLETSTIAELYPVDFGTEKCLPSKSFGPYIRRYYLIHYILNGEGTFKNENSTYHVKKGQAFLIRPGELCTYTADNTNPWEYIWIGLDGKMSLDFDLCEDVFEPDGSIFLEMMDVKNYENLAREYLTGVALKLYCSIFTTRKKTDYISKVIGYINSNYMHDVKISHIAQMVNLNRKYLSRIFKEKMNMSIKDYLTFKRLSEAKKLLEEGYNVSETASMTGYSDYFVFSKAYKNYYGYPPLKTKTAKF